MKASIEGRLRADVIDGLLMASRRADYGRDDDLLALLDSLQLLRLADQVESTFGIRIANSELTVENIGTLARLEAFVDGKIAARGAPRRAGLRSWISARH